MRQGVIPSHMIETMVAQGQISISEPLQDDQVQPASLDLRLGHTAYRVRASFLAGQAATVAERLREFEMHRIDLSEGAVLEKGCVYLVPLMEGLDLPPDYRGRGQCKILDRAIGSFDTNHHRSRQGV